MAIFLVDPRLKKLKIGTASRFAVQRELIRERPCVKRCYDLWYRLMLEDLSTTPDDSLGILEIGSGASYIKELNSAIITSDVVPGLVDMVIDARKLPFADNSLRAIFLTHVFHHLPDVEAFLFEAERVLAPGGIISMVDETATPFARLFFDLVHPEPFDASSESWSYDSTGSEFDANQALAWIVFQRDRTRFERMFPRFRIERMQYLPWLSYLLSGGVNLPSLIPRPLAPIFIKLDDWLSVINRWFAIHWHITVRKQ